MRELITRRTLSHSAPGSPIPIINSISARQKSSSDTWPNTSIGHLLKWSQHVSKLKLHVTSHVSYYDTVPFPSKSFPNATPTQRKIWNLYIGMHVFKTRRIDRTV